MARTNTAEILPTDTLANLYSDLNDKVIIEAGPNNTKDDVGRLFKILIPRRLAQFSTQAAQFVSNNWNGTRHGANKVETDAEKVAYFEKLMEEWEPPEASLKSPVEQAIFDTFAERNAGQLVGHTPAAIDAKITPLVVKTLNDPSKTEQAMAIVDRYVEKMRGYNVPRSRKGEKVAGSISGELNESLD